MLLPDILSHVANQFPASSLNGKGENVLWPLHDLERRRLARIRVVSHEIAYFLHVFEDWVTPGFDCELLQGANERVDKSVERKKAREKGGEGDVPFL